LCPLSAFKLISLFLAVKTTDSIRLLAPAKINLRIEVLNRRPDGYHNIRSIMCTVDLHDVLTLSPCPHGISLSCNSPHLPLDEHNLAYRAAALVIERAGLTTGMHIDLEKHIPAAAGLGGGSSDAAAAMRGVCELFRLSYPREELMKLGVQLGADVPFFFSESPSIATGIGETLKPISLSPSFWTVLVTPPLSVSTAWAYGHITLHPDRTLCPLSDKIDLREIGNGILYNDFEDIVLPAFPLVREAKELLLRLNAWGALMSGSGPTVFGVFFDEHQARRAEATLMKHYSGQGWNIALAQTLYY
jgi:4-diphosphocytidyl-2-C-methyl-D-erythritol kinase